MTIVISYSKDGETTNLVTFAEDGYVGSARCGLICIHQFCETISYCESVYRIVRFESTDTHKNIPPNIQ